MTTTERPSVFLSSAVYGSEDLRSTLIDFFRNKKGYLPIYFGDRCSGDLTGQPGIVEQCLNGVRTSNALVLIVDKRYGEPNQEDEDGISVSITESEFLEASKNKLPIYIFCREEVWIAHKIWETNPNMNFRFDDRYDYPRKLMNFLTKLKEGDRLILRFRDADDLKYVLLNVRFSVEVLKYEPDIIDESDNLEVYS